MIAFHPAALAEVERVRGSRAARRALLTRFPYWLVFAVLGEQDVLVVALAHTRRRASYWRRRVGAKR